MILKNILIFFKIKQIIGKNLNNPKGDSFKENHLIKVAEYDMEYIVLFQKGNSGGPLVNMVSSIKDVEWK
jgi:hypothetical protein